MLTQWSKLPENAVSYDADPPPFSEAEAEAYMRKVYDGIVTKESLDIKYHDEVGGYLQKGAERGFKGKPSDFTPESGEYVTIKDIRRNIYQFSAAKQYQQVVIMSEFIHEAGLKVPFNKFKDLAGLVFNEYNVNYLKAEFITAVGQAQSARDWLYFEENAEQFPWLTYHTQRDTQVRDEHKTLDGYTAKVSDPAWRTIAPKNGWRCRCFLTAHEKGVRSTRKLPEFGTPGWPEIFEMNPGVDKLIFDPKKHPYFFVEKGDAALKKKNFNLPVPK